MKRDIRDFTIEELKCEMDAMGEPCPLGHLIIPLKSNPTPAFNN